MHRGRLRFIAIALPLLVSAPSCASVLGLERGELRAEEPTDMSDTRPSADAGADGALVLDDALAYYPFEEAAGATRVANRARSTGSEPPSARDGAVFGATLGLAGVRSDVDRAMAADAPGARVELTWSRLPGGNEPFSLEVAIAPREIVAEPRTVVAHHDDVGGAFAGYRIVATGSEVALERRATNGQTELLRADHSLAANRWTHVAVTYDGGRLRLIVDGVIAEEIRTTRRVDATGTTLIIGSRGDDELPFAGRIDELAIYARELSDQIVASHAQLLR